MPSSNFWMLFYVALFFAAGITMTGGVAAALYLA